ncbi:unnamed protein product, partial [Rotaria magnacalcarata]
MADILRRVAVLAIN